MFNINDGHRRLFLERSQAGDRPRSFLYDRLQPPCLHHQPTPPDYDLHVSSFLLATGSALVVTKAVLAADALPFFNHFRNSPLIKPILYKSCLYFLVACLARFIEELIDYVSHGGAVRGIPEYISTHFFWNRFVAIQLWMLVLFLIYTFVSELNLLFGDGELRRILFSWRSTDIRLSRRRRIRTLAKLTRLADAHTVVELRNPTTAAHAEMIGLVRGLGHSP